MTETYSSIIASPVGNLRLTVSGGYLNSLLFTEEEVHEFVHSDEVTEKAAAQLNEYFSGNRMNFDLPLEPSGTSFQQSVWNQLQAIPFGETKTYLDIAISLGDRNKIRAVGLANGKNPLAIIVPCHRVIGSNNQLIGYAGGLWRKKWLLEFEAKLSPKGLFNF
jgi:methylated-DNA-[protein]-cysteine S-methyltransferase